MMNLDNPLPPILNAFEATRDALRVARRLIPELEAKQPDCQDELFHQRRKLLNRTVFPNHPNGKVLLEQTEKEIQDLFVLNLWVVFERFVRIYLQQIRGPENSQPHFCEALYQYFNKKVESLTAQEVLDFLKLSFFNTDEGSHLIGSAKQILEYRNWVAHRNPKKRSPVKIVPNMAYDTLNEIIETLLQHS
jgi:hypothetical protein